ncbi:conserved exported hypothetical protein [Vibrio chagasii]|nr:conserved exported hypothetical protein [Vibrio chagasii]CAH6851329.1 conserved exported hypothetical protein [Vibrio chagasii]CAH6852881.1 conserved exported hypothetical protein [Vibrio chagasii]CAH6865265.1 conserved exported hypothetical protein [Vibrio chagasii]CAH6869211.1 conserved exported hypothetical protein [Vibrio chagasii]
MTALRTLLTVSLSILPFHSAVASPMFVYAQSPIHSNVLSTQLRSAEPNRTGTIEFKSSYTQASIWAHTQAYSLDYYQNQSNIAVQWQASPIWKTELDYRVVTAKDSGLDSFVMGFHDLFGVGQNGRDEVAEDQFTMDFHNAGVHVSDFEGDDLTNAITFYNELLLYSRGPMSLSAGGSLFYNNVRSGQFARTSFEQGVQLNYSYITPRHSFFSTIGLVHRNSDGHLVSDERLALENVSASWAVGYEYRWNQRHSFVLESLNYQGWATNDPDFSEPSNEVVVGYCYRLYRLALEALMIENIRNMDNSTDIGFTLGVRFSI